MLNLFANFTEVADSERKYRFPWTDYGDKAWPFSGVTSYGRVWRKGAGKRGLESGHHSLTTKQQDILS